MAWATPITHSVGDILTASDWNISSNDISFLAGTTGATVGTLQTTGSTSYTDLTTVGPAVTLTTGANALVIIGCAASNSTNQMAMSFAVSGATTVAAADSNSVQPSPGATAVGAQNSNGFVLSSLNAGSNTFTAKYRAITGGTASFAFRNIAVIPLP